MTKFDKQFKVDAVQYYHDHRDLGLIGCAHNLGISQQTLSRWQKQLRDNGEMPYRGSGNYASDEAKEIARLKRELRDAKDAIDVQKSYQHSRQIILPFTIASNRRLKSPSGETPFSVSECWQNWAFYIRLLWMESSQIIQNKLRTVRR